MEVVAAFDNWPDALAVYRNNFSHPAIHADLMNVERILKTQKLQDALKIFKTAGYGLTYTVLNAALCGVPQKRKRFVMVGKLGAEDDFMKNALLENLSDHEMSVAEYFGDKMAIKYYYRHPRSYARRGIFSTSEPSATIRGVNRPMPKGYTLHPGDPVDSLEGIRPLTSLERSMIQTFPEDLPRHSILCYLCALLEEGRAVVQKQGFYRSVRIWQRAKHVFSAATVVRSRRNGWANARRVESGTPLRRRCWFARRSLRQGGCTCLLRQACRSLSMRCR